MREIHFKLFPRGYVVKGSMGNCMSLHPPLFTLNRIGHVSGWERISTSSDPHSQSLSSLSLNGGVRVVSWWRRDYILQIPGVRVASFDDNLLTVISNIP